MAGEAKRVHAEIEILQIRLDALEGILRPSAQYSRSPEPYVNFEFAKEEIAELCQRSEELHNLCHYKARFQILQSTRILERAIALKTFLIVFKQATSPEDMIATLTARNQELIATVEMLETAVKRESQG